MLRRFGAALAAVVVGILASSAPVGAQATAGAGVIEGRVTEAGGAALAGAPVQVLQGAQVVRSATTDAAGRYRFEGLVPGAYTIRAEALGYSAAERGVRLVAGGAPRVMLVLEPAPVALARLDVVSATRTSAPVSTIPSSVTVLDREAVAGQAAVSAGLGGALAQLVPGLAAGTGSMSNFGQSFRGRNVAVLIDGIPQSTSRNAMRDFATIDPSAVERVEVLRGATAIYGDGATGGVINIITRSPEAGARYSTSVGVEASASEPGSGAGTRVAQSVSGAHGAVDYLIGGSLSRTGAYFDGEGDRIPSDPQGQGGLADYRSWNVLAKLGGRFGDRRVELTLNRFDGVQDTEYTTDPAVNAAEPGTKARALEGLDLKEFVGSQNLNVALGYSETGVLGGQLRGQLFYRDYKTNFGPFDGRRYLKHVAQSFVDSEKLGARVEHETTIPVATAPTVVWGIDYTDETTFQGLNLMDAAAYDQSGGLSFRKVGETKWVPPIDSRSLGVFAQLGWSPVARVSVRGGVRHERVRMHVDDFTTVTGNAVEGGDLDYAPVLYNIGAVVSATDAFNVFASYSQGFSLADIGRVLRGAPAGFSLVSKQLEAQLVDHYELGARAHWDALQLSASVFRNTSDLGTTLDKDLNVKRAPERVRGFEASADARVAPALSFGGTFTWTEGESYDEASDEWKALDGFRIQPTKLTLYGEHRTLPSWTNRLQLLHSGSRDRAFEAGLTYGHLAVESYTVADWTSRVAVGPGTLELGVHNLFDTQYFPIISQLYAQWGNSVRAAARGRTLSLGYSVRY